ncbi:MAG: hypothetical protein ACJ8AO_09980 [Gemmatimonadaceae bacterium]
MTASTPPTPEPAGVPRIGRLLDLAALGLLAGGAALYGRAWAGMRVLQDRTGASPSFGAAMAEFDRWWRLSRVGIVLLGVGVLVGVGAAVIAARRARAV